MPHSAESNGTDLRSEPTPEDVARAEEFSRTWNKPGPEEVLWFPGDPKRFVSKLAAAFAQDREERERLVKAVFGFVHSEHCPATHEATGAQIKCLACVRVELEAEVARLRKEITPGGWGGAGVY